MKPYTLNDKSSPGIQLEGGEGGYVPHLVLGRTGSEVGFVIAVNKELNKDNAGNGRLRHHCSVTKHEDGRLEITKGDDQNDKRLLVLVQSHDSTVQHSLGNVEIVVSTRLRGLGRTHSLVVVEPGARIPMNRGDYSRGEYFEFQNNDGVPEIVPKYSLPEQPKKQEPAAKTEPEKPVQKGRPALLFWLGIVVGFVVANAMHLLRPM